MGTEEKIAELVQGVGDGSLAGEQLAETLRALVKAAKLEGMESLIAEDRRQWSAAWQPDHLLRTAVESAFSETMKTSSRGNASQLSPERLEVRKELERMTKLIADQPAWKELSSRMCGYAKAIVGASVEEHGKAIAEERASYERMRSEWEQSDPVAKRIIGLRKHVEEMFPMPDWNASGAMKEQTIRSRGLVMAGLAGITTMGGSTQQWSEPSEPGKRRQGGSA